MTDSGTLCAAPTSGTDVRVCTVGHLNRTVIVFVTAPLAMSGPMSVQVVLSSKFFLNYTYNFSTTLIGSPTVTSVVCMGRCAAVTPTAVSKLLQDWGYHPLQVAQEHRAVVHWFFLMDWDVPRSTRSGAARDRGMKGEGRRNRPWLSGPAALTPKGR